jgi:hypothetical protein
MIHCPKMLVIQERQRENATFGTIDLGLSGCNAYDTVWVHPSSATEHPAGTADAAKVLGADEEERSWLVLCVCWCMHQNSSIGFVQVASRHKADM